ncbi:MAG TPA: transglycosylase domain-containing protein [Nitrolancea sp.]|nr:transglycosylase domain-containing protein [Nitrolancea sp.]
MSHGNLYRQSLSRPRGQRRAARFGRAGRVLPRPRPLPPELLHAGPRRRPRQPLLRRTASLGCLALLLGAGLWAGLIAAVAAGGYTAWSSITSTLPTLAQMQQPSFATTKIYDRNGILLYQVADPNSGWRTPVGYQEILDHIGQQQQSPNAPHHAWIFDATVAAEDASFWTNHGVDPTAIARSFVEDISGSGFSGASTITQQLVRLVYPDQIGYQVSYSRKLREAIMAYRFSQHFTKPQILEMYLNDIYYGEGAYGIDAASEIYFGEHPWDLSLGQAALLAGLPQAPTAYDPFDNYQAARARQQYVLAQMVKTGAITSQQADDAYATPITLAPPDVTRPSAPLAPHFVNFVLGWLEQRFGSNAVYGGGLIVKTTLDYHLQQTAQQIVAKQVKQIAWDDVDNGALVAMLPETGEIVAMVGSADYYNNAIDGQVNVAVMPRSPGSSIKPVTYLAALERGFYPGTILNDTDKKYPIPGQPGKFYEPHNDTFKHYGKVTVREALDNSLNVPAVETLNYVGVQTMIDLDHALGNKSTMYSGYYGLSVTVGGGDVTLLDHTTVFATLANEGRYVPYTPVLQVNGQGGKLLYQLNRGKAEQDGQQVAPAGNVYQISNILSDNKARTMIFGANSPLHVPELNRPVAAKTGTSDGPRDGLTMGYTTDLVVGVWTGNTDNSLMGSLDAVSTAGPIWHDFMVAAHQPRFATTLAGPDGKPVPPDFPVPPNVSMGKACDKPTPEVLVRGVKVVCDAGAP